MSNNKKGQSTGPKTQDGKAASSQNARKDSIFVQGYLPWEDQEAKRQDFDALIKQWRAKDPTRPILIRSIEQSAMSVERMMYAQARKIEGLMQSVTVARSFYERAGLSSLAASSLPHWFFLEDDDDEKQRALMLAEIFDEAFDLKSSYSVQLVSKIKETYPTLYQYVMDSYKEGASFASLLGHRYEQSIPTMNLVKLMNDLKEKYPHHFTWAENPTRYQIIIDGLRAEQIEEAMNLDKTNRYTTNIQNRVAKGIATLAPIDQHEYQLKMQSESVNHTKLVVLPSQIEEKKSDSSE